MNGGKSERLRDLWLPALIGFAGVVVSVAVWGLLVVDRREQILAVAADTSVETREAVREALEHQFELLRDLRDLWTRFGLDAAEEWKEDIGQRVDRAAGLASIAWVDLDDAGSRFAIQRDAVGEEPTGLDPVKARQHLDAPYLEGPVRDASGATQYQVFLPLRTPEGHAGVLVARFRTAPFLEAVLNARARGYALSVSWQGHEIFSRGAPSTDPWQEWWRAEGTVELPLGGAWRVVGRPTPEFAAERLTPTPHYLLGAGILLSLVLALVAYQLRLIVRQSRFLAASNRALEQRGIELETRVAERTEALQNAVTELEAFNYSVSHDLRSPLGAILNFAAILEEDHALDADGAALLARIRRSATRATTLLDGLLRFSRAGRAGLTLERVNMTALARQAFAQVRTSEDDAEVELVVAPLPETFGDCALLGDVFANLLGNALKYSRGCEKRRIAVTGRIEGGERIYEVADNGRGFDTRYVGKLFGLFERLESEDDVEGTGVGLAIVARIVHRHEGRVWAEGRLGEGARFSFALPVRETS